MRTTVTVRGQTAVPAEIRRKYHIKGRMKLEWIDDGNVITVIPVSEDPIKYARGMLKGTGLTKSLLKARAEERKLENKLKGYVLK
ncbi:hypothetical protein AUJ66_07590 [Candidatus Desantisbacteria bacterium CG1_02_38_46]|uniref:AbrB family transcriptional regulator n=3 Tax=unclassified Candidatus Desantisiibacteriota TaxID=3106372 RepID=A0A2H9PA91_9BACT|nr:MAG: hypothetical protein AUJ66_07590 [Candidatus Desantisbacteria bacterium CG1_02_38_46]PIU51574.1 MAG: AbrB family transcriptional regulator [Candidatus Desantisbacteria bacterium CG07_land_8_20_14_0_80_39_15]PIZ15311.1 MAG: AbrB family transcriptional regulator [Candidatus Desantisbacteria bacterium CG_4_10_14_0_8_um_filter_39_17]